MRRDNSAGCCFVACTAIPLDAHFRRELLFLFYFPGSRGGCNVLEIERRVCMFADRRVYFTCIHVYVYIVCMPLVMCEISFLRVPLGQRKRECENESR